MDKQSAIKTLEFIDYVYSFYNQYDGIYKEVKATKEQIVDAMFILLTHDDYVGYDFVGDSFDREKIREIIEKNSWIYD